MVQIAVATISVTSIVRPYSRLPDILLNVLQFVIGLILSKIHINKFQFNINNTSRDKLSTISRRTNFQVAYLHS